MKLRRYCATDMGHTIPARKFFTMHSAIQWLVRHASYSHLSVWRNGKWVRTWRREALLRVVERGMPTWHCLNCNRNQYGETTECWKCGYYRRKEQY
jgi:hypothetical protein